MAAVSGAVWVAAARGIAGVPGGEWLPALALLLALLLTLLLALPPDCGRLCTAVFFFSS